MPQQITCPVCQRSAIEIDICPNCQTDLSLVRMLTELPPIDTVVDKFSWQNLSIGIFSFLSLLIFMSWKVWQVF